MSESVPKTPGEETPAGTGGDNTPAATPPQGTPGATDDDTVTMSKKDYNALIGGRDRNNNELGELRETVGDLQANQAYAAQEKSVTQFLETNKDKYPDVQVEDLMGRPLEESEIEEIAKSTQKRLEDVVQKRLMNVQRATAPALSPAEKAAELKKLKDNPGSASFQRMLELQQ